LRVLNFLRFVSDYEILKGGDSRDPQSPFKELALSSNPTQMIIKMVKHVENRAIPKQQSCAPYGVA
jgi:hypothetical protein